MKKSKKIRKPKSLKTKSPADVYSGIEPNFSHPQRVVYIGGSYFDSSSQIHLSTYEARELHKWLGRAIAYLEQKEAK
jgi:hypothetical protein